MQSSSVDPGALRRGALAASVLHDIPLQPSSDGVLVGRSWDDRDAWTPVGWGALADALAGADPESLTGRLRLRDWLQGYLALQVVLAQAPSVDRPAWAAANALATGAPARVVALALPAGHVLHPGAGWVREQVLGGVLDVGLGLRPDPAVPSPEGVRAPEALSSAVAVPLPPGAVRELDVDVDRWWDAAAEQRDSMAALAVDRLQRDGQGVVRPIGGCDVLTLLSGRVLRAHLATSDGTGLRAVAVPMRSRGWFDLARIDPAFVGAAAAATEPEQRGVERPLLVTADEITVVPVAPPAELARLALADPAAHQPLHLRDVLYR